MIRLPSVRISKLTLQNAAALLSLPAYLLARPILRCLRVLRPGQSERWVISGHSGRLYADNAAALHTLLLERGRDVAWICSEPSLSRELSRSGARVLPRNSWAARIAIENASVLAYSHGFSDLDHILPKVVALQGLKIHLNHCMSHLKAWGTSRFPTLPGASAEHERAPRRGLPFDYLLASSEREQHNLLQSFQGADGRVLVGGGPHLDAFMRARAARPERLIAYFPTFREGARANEQLSANIAQLGAHPRLLTWLQQHDYTLCLLGHVNSARADAAQHPHVRVVSPQDLLDVVLRAELLISDYSGLICDYLALDRAMIFFPFDKDEYLAKRKLYVPYDDFAFGPEVREVEALVELIVSGAFRDRSAFDVKRRHWERELFPVLAASYAERTLSTIDALRAARTRAP